MTKFKKILLALALSAAIPATAYANVTRGDIQRLQDLILDIATANFTKAFGVDSAATNNVSDLNLTAPADTTGTNTHQGYNVDLTIGNATGGTNTVNAFNLGAVTGDAQVDINGLKIGTGSRLGTTNAITLGSGWDKGINITNSAAADSAATEMGIDLNLTTPVDTTGTNTHYGLNLDFSIGNATGGTNTARGLNIAAVTGDAQVDVTGIAIGTGTTLGTSYAISVGSGWDAGLSMASKVLNTYAAGIDSAATNIAESFALAFPADTAGTNTHTAIDIAITAANATGGTNTANGINFPNYTGDAQVNVNAIKIGTSDGLGTATAITVGTGWDIGLEIASPASLTNDLYGDGGDQFYGFLHDQVASTTVSTTAAQCDKTFVSDSADTMTLPEASTVLGCRYTFVCGTVDDFVINPADASDVIGTVASITGTNTTTVLAPSAGDRKSTRLNSSHSQI